MKAVKMKGRTLECYGTKEEDTGQKMGEMLVKFTVQVRHGSS